MLAIFVLATSWIVISARSVDTKANRGHCDIHPWRRVECGWAGITKGRCESLGCCFDPTHKYSLWCFKKNQREQENKNIAKLETAGTFVRSCSFESSKRIDCGWAGIHKDVCELRGCCYDDKERNNYWCFYPESRFTMPKIENVMRCVAKCTSYSWSKTVAIGTSCFADADCWWRKDGIIAASCLQMCKKNSSISGSTVANITSCLKDFGIEDESGILDCEFDTECWEKKFGKVSTRCLKEISQESNRDGRKAEIAMHPDIAIEPPPSSEETPREPNITGALAPPPQNVAVNRTHEDVEKSVGSITDKTEKDEETDEA